ncbi:uncharacterized protein LOC135834695 [Planococcus citri]|uniref:uncharacterized protein LOC135834695 n=1 Tax=Planococcus citri TaxID=170843 RepID=UPI0031F8FA40
MSIILLLLIIVLMMIKTNKLVCGVFSYKTASIAVLSCPVLSFIQSFISKYIEAENSFEFQTADFIGFFFVCIGISGLIGIEKEKPSLMKPFLLTMWVLIATAFTVAIMCIIDHFDFKKGEFSPSDSKKFQYALIIGLTTLYGGQILLTHYVNLLGEDQPFKSTKASESKPPSKALINNV